MGLLSTPAHADRTEVRRVNGVICLHHTVTHQNGVCADQARAGRSGHRLFSSTYVRFWAGRCVRVRKITVAMKCLPVALVAPPDGLEL